MLFTVVYFFAKPHRQTVVNQLSCWFNPCLSQFFFSFWTFLEHFFFSDRNCLSFCFDTKITVYHTVSRALIVCMTCSVLACKVASFFHLFADSCKCSSINRMAAGVAYWYTGSAFHQISQSYFNHIYFVYTITRAGSCRDERRYRLQPPCTPIHCM